MIITTSRYPDHETVSLAKQLALSFGAPFISRGKRNISSFSRIVVRYGVTRLGILRRVRGVLRLDVYSFNIGSRRLFFLASVPVVFDYAQY